MPKNDIVINGGRILIGDGFEDASLAIADGFVARAGSGGNAKLQLDARGLRVLPGIVDIHGDAFERQMMPRPGVDFPIDVALVDSDRQAIANGITTVFHAATWSWEPGLRGAGNAKRLACAIEIEQHRLLADTHFHLRHETFNLEAEPTIASWLSEGRIGLLAFNDHMTSTLTSLANSDKRRRMAERAGLAQEDFNGLVERVAARRDDVPFVTDRLAAIASRYGVPLLSHDDDTPELRRTYRARGVRIAEFPVNEATAREAISHNEDTVFGAPNVVRGGSHTGWVSAADMIGKGLCTILASDYYYPAPLLAAFRLASDGALPLTEAWRLVSAHPAKAVGLGDRGEIAAGKRADIVLADDRNPRRPQIIAVIANGRLVYISEANRLSRPVETSQSVVAA